MSPNSPGPKSSLNWGRPGQTQEEAGACAGGEDPTRSPQRFPQRRQVPPWMGLGLPAPHRGDREARLSGSVWVCRSGSRGHHMKPGLRLSARMCGDTWASRTRGGQELALVVTGRSGQEGCPSERAGCWVTLAGPGPLGGTHFLAGSVKVGGVTSEASACSHVLFSQLCAIDHGVAGRRSAHGPLGEWISASLPLSEQTAQSEQQATQDCLTAWNSELASVVT